MNRKTAPLYIAIGIAIIAIGAILTFLLSGIFQKGEEEKSFYWLPEESFFVDYDIVDEKTIKFRYTICFVNNLDVDTTISLSAKFDKKELAGWVVQTDGFMGCDENGELLYKEIKQGEKEFVTVTFEGKYLGGEVNENLSFPEELILSQSFS